MKKSLIISILLILCFSISTLFGCTNNYSNGCSTCKATLKCIGSTTDCSNFLCDAIMGEKCSDKCFVAPWFDCSDCIGNFSCHSYCGCPSTLTKGLDDITSYCIVSPRVLVNIVPEFRTYYEVFVSFDLLSEYNFRNVCIEFDVEDNKGNKRKNVEFCVTDVLYSNDIFESDSVSFMFKCKDEQDRADILKEDIKVTIKAVYGTKPDNFIA